jgi:Family of unknown function (DUF5988)
MTHATPSQSGQMTIDAVLVGGPSDMEPSRRMVHGVTLDEVKIKVLHRGGYEHFVRDTIQHSADASPSDSGATVAAIYHWSARTEVAE